MNHEIAEIKKMMPDLERLGPAKNEIPREATEKLLELALSLNLMRLHDEKEFFGKIKDGYV